jgi:hypothetical protein
MFDGDLEKYHLAIGYELDEQGLRVSEKLAA